MKIDKRILNFIHNYEIKTNKGIDFTFKQHPFLYLPLIDESDEIVIEKATQMGVSTTILYKQFYWGIEKYPCSNFLYTLPSKGVTEDFVRIKVNPIIENSKLSEKVLEKKEVLSKKGFSLHLIRMGDSFYVYRGSFSISQAQSLDIDFLLIDELDFQNLKIKDMFEERLSGLGLKKKRIYVSIPILTEGGIATEFEKSDQKEWFIRCPFCSKEQILEYPKNFNLDKKILICDSCHQPIKKETILKGRWMPLFPQRKISGYHFSHMMATWIKPSKIIDKYQKDPAHTTQFNLGLPYQEKAKMIDAEKISFKSYPEIYDPVELSKRKSEPLLACGIDQGDLYHLIYGEIEAESVKILSVQEMTSPIEVENFLKNAKIDFVLMDMLPAKHIAKAFQRSLGNSKPGFHFPEFWIGNLTQSSIPRLEYFEAFEKEKRLRIEKTEAIDKMLLQVMSGKIAFPVNLKEKAKLIKHLKALYPVYKEYSGNLMKFWRKKGKDDFALALVFLLAARDFISPKPKPIETKEKTIGPIEEYKKALFSQDFMTREIDLQTYKNLVKKNMGNVFVIRAKK